MVDSEKGVNRVWIETTKLTIHWKALPSGVFYWFSGKLPYSFAKYCNLKIIFQNITEKVSTVTNFAFLRLFFRCAINQILVHSVVFSYQNLETGTVSKFVAVCFLEKSSAKGTYFFNFRRILTFFEV